MRGGSGRDALGALGALAALLGVAGVLWALPVAATLTYARGLPAMSASEAIVGTVTIAVKSRWSQPRAAYPARVRRQMPPGGWWWLGAGLPFGVFGVVAAVLVGPVDVSTARRRLGRRGYDPRGARPREWARPRDVRSLAVGVRSGARMTLGSLDGRLLAADPEAMIALTAPPRAGKTTGCVIPWLLEHDGPALVTSSKEDVRDTTAGWRARGGEVWSFDPFTPGSCCWDPLEGCEQWGFALRQGKWLADAAGHSDHSHVAEFWGQEAAKLLAPLLHAAALAGSSIGEVIGWLDAQEADAPVRLLADGGDPAAKVQLEGVLGLDSRNRGTTYMSASNLLAAYRYPEVLATARPGFTPAQLLDGGASTLYITASSRHQRLLAPVIVALVSSVLEQAVETSRAQGAPLDPLLRVLLDETANCAPLQDLPAHLSQLAAHGVRIATVWQSLAQARDRYGEATDTIMAASTCKIFMGPVTDDTTRRYLDGLLGQRPVEVDDHHTLGPKASAQELQQLDRSRALVIAGELPPAIVRLDPYWQIRDFRALEAGAAALGRG